MYCRSYAQLASIILLPVLSGACVQMTRHSNMMIFGTNTVVGLRVGVNATSVPEVAIGYTRQEAVVLPLVANVAESGHDPNRLTPCTLTDGVGGTGDATLGSGAKYAVHPCSLVAIRGDALDSYSVLASFGGNFSASGDKDKSTAQAGVAQYFSTGIAAQLLAANGGAALVATGDAAKASSLKDPVTLADLTPTAATFSVVAPRVIRWQAARAALSDKIKATAPEHLGDRLAAFEAAIDGTPVALFAQCKIKTICQDLVDGDVYRGNFNASATKFQAAVNAWTIP